MINANLQALIQSVIEITNLHVSKPSKEAMTSTNWAFIFDDYDGWVVLQVISRGKGGYWMHSNLYPETKIEEALKNNLHEFSFQPNSSAYDHVISGNDHRLEPFWGENNKFNETEVPLYFSRFYYGKPKGKENYIEFNQLITHPLDLHWSQNKSAYCSINEMGEEIEKIKIIDTEEVELILIRRQTLDKLLYLGKWVLVRYFSFNRWIGDFPAFAGNKTNLVEPQEFNGKFIIRTYGTEKIEYSEFRGVQIVKPTTPKEKLLNWSFRDTEEEDKKYATFTVYDWKNKRILEDYSIDPVNLANYFKKSALPYETSPIFFNAEVLDKYKNNADKYNLDERRITCHGGWELNTFDINEQNQVHTYAIYLSRLPYREQLHWKQYNEKPNGGLSKRAIQTDFEAKFPDEESKLSQLQNELEKLNKIKFNNASGPLWSPKGGDWESASKGLFYLKTENANQWHDFIIALANTVNEGLQTDTLKKIAVSFGNQNNELRSLGLLKFIISATGNEQFLPQTHGVLNDLQDRRSQGKAHGSWKTPEGSLIKDAEKRLEEVIEAIKKINELFSKLQPK